MKAKKLLSRIALILAMILMISTFAACDLDELLGGGGSDEDENDAKSSVKTYIYTDVLPESIDEINDKGWTASSKFALAADMSFEPGMKVVHLGKIENTGSLAMAYQLYFNTKGDINPIADYVSLQVVVSDANDGRIVDTVNISSVSSVLGNKGTFSSGVIMPGDVYYISLMFYMENDVENNFDEYTLGPKINLACKAKKTSAEKDEFGDSYDSGFVSGSYIGSGNNVGSGEFEETYSYVETYEGYDTDKWQSEATSEDDFSIISSENYYYLNIGDRSINWSTSLHHSDFQQKAFLIINETGYVSFDFVVSSEENCDFFIIYINGIEQCRYSGEVSNSFCMFVSAGDIVELVYTKDSSVNVGSDTVNVYSILLSKEGRYEDTTSEYETYFETETVETTDVYIEYKEPVQLDIDYWEYFEITSFSFGTVSDAYGESYDVWFSTNHDSDSYSTLAIKINRRGTVSFAARVPSESCDRLTVSVNGNEVYSNSASYDWSDEITVDVEAGNLLVFQYKKDGSVDVEDDCAYIRNLQFIIYDNSASIPEGPIYDFELETAPIEDCATLEYSDFDIRDLLDSYGNVIRTEHYASGVSDNSSALMRWNIARTGYFYFEHFASSEEGCDFLSVCVNGNEQTAISGTAYEYGYEMIYVEAGDTLTFEYRKDGSVSYGDDTVYIGCFCFVPLDTMDPDAPAPDVPEFSDFFNENVSWGENDFYLEEETDEYGYSHNKTYISQNHDDGSSSAMEFAMNCDGELRFEWRVSTESGCDILYLYVNGEYYHSISGNFDYYEEYCLSLNAGDCVRFVYSKDSSSSNYEDTVYIRNFLFFPNTDVETAPPTSGGTEIVITSSEYFSSYTYENNGTHRVWHSTNQQKSDTTASLSFFAPAEGFITFDYTVSSEEDVDMFYVLVDGAIALKDSGNKSVPDQSIFVTAGARVEIQYYKDGSGNGGVDGVTITDLSFVPGH